MYGLALFIRSCKKFVLLCARSNGRASHMIICSIWRARALGEDSLPPPKKKFPRKMIPMAPLLSQELLKSLREEHGLCHPTIQHRFQDRQYVCIHHINLGIIPCHDRDQHLRRYHHHQFTTDDIILAELNANFALVGIKTPDFKKASKPVVHHVYPQYSIQRCHAS